MKQVAKKIIRMVLSLFIIKDYLVFLNKDTSKRFKIKISDFYPQIKDKTVETNFDRHYIYHTAWATRKLKQINPEKHIDISSSLYFSANISAFIPTEFYDYRPANIKLSNLESKKGDLHNLPFESESIKSLSCMHTIEHIGLGRYGDLIDPNGDIKATKEINRVLQKGGSFLFVAPIGKPKIEFNAHRIYSYKQVLELFPELQIKEFSLIPEFEGGIIENADPSLVEKENYACGCFWFIK